MIIYRNNQSYDFSLLKLRVRECFERGGIEIDLLQSIDLLCAMYMCLESWTFIQHSFGILKKSPFYFLFIKYNMVKIPTYKNNDYLTETRQHNPIPTYVGKVYGRMYIHIIITQLQLHRSKKNTTSRTSQ